jgi:sugar phosphate permease
VAAAALIGAFVAIELRSRAPLLPLRIFRLRSLMAANVIALIIAAIVFSQFFVLTLYMQQVLGYSAMQTGVAFVAVTLTIVVVSNVAQMLVTRIGVRTVLTTGLVLTSVAVALLARIPEDGDYFRDLFVPFLLTGIGMALSFIPMTIAGLSGVARADAGVASGLINTSRQIGGAVGLAAVSTIAAAYTSDGATAQVADAGLIHGFHVAFYVLTALAVAGALVAAFAIERRPTVAPVALRPSESIEPLEEAA